MGVGGTAVPVQKHVSNERRAKMHYHDLLEQAKKRMLCDTKHLFLWAKQWSGDHGDVQVDVLTYEVGGIIPEYVKAYLDGNV